MRVLGEEAVARMDGSNVVLLGDGDDTVDVEIGANGLAGTADTIHRLASVRPGRRRAAALSHFVLREKTCGKMKINVHLQPKIAIDIVGTWLRSPARPLIRAFAVEHREGPERRTRL